LLAPQVVKGVKLGRLQAKFFEKNFLNIGNRLIFVKQKAVAGSASFNYFLALHIEPYS
jgi:hypothetical protein